ncbi:hypothetical protein NA57DRAFT_37820 [Rhizodiscina lignyota]|uniref:FAD/NAD(P)-binding domain-containing protein n=1 Tax=Rhizodiscina lignyota TaxID=1504668 RepID=A0A9P4IIW2_9PEZI|nr:hypothetical protein NA57DRAFT_37820 [Rhizodiscina lignyota]
MKRLVFASPTPSDSECLNSQNCDSSIPSHSDVVVIGGGIHSLIYAIHAHIKSESLRQSGSGRAISITVLEKSQSPGYKIGESTLTTFGVWLKSIGISNALLWRLFGVKDGLAFYFLPHNGDRDGYTDFCANGPPGDSVATLQIERKISELLLTLFAQRLGVRVLHGHSANIDSVQLPEADSGGIGHVDVLNGSGQGQISTDLVVDGTGRFRRLASKASKTTRLPPFNTDAFWAYFEMSGDESDIPLDHYESCHTNHICIAEGWAWVIRLPSWEGSPLPNLIAMINHLLDFNAANTAPDSYPSTHQLVEKFKLKFRWVVSIGYALRNDVVYPDDLNSYGTCEAERKFKWITSRYPRMQELMDQHVLITDLYGPKPTWFIRKSLTYQSPVAAGTGWAAIGDATGFTNPLYSPGINCSMGTSVFLAEKTPKYLAAQGSTARRAILDSYNEFCGPRIENLHRMNVGNYLLFRSPQIGRLGPLWQYLCGTGNAEWQHIEDFTQFDRVAELVTTWEWGANRPEYISFMDNIIPLLEGAPDAPSKEVVDKVLSLSEKMIAEVIKTGKYRNRWAGLFRYYDDDLAFHPDKISRDVLASRCEKCGNWRMLSAEMKKCPICGTTNKVVAIQRYN